MLAWVSPTHRASRPQSSAPVVACGSIFSPLLVVLVVVVLVTGPCCLPARGLPYEAPYTTRTFLIRALLLSALLSLYSRRTVSRSLARALRSTLRFLKEHRRLTARDGRTLSRARARSLALATRAHRTHNRGVNI